MNAPIEYRVDQRGFTLIEVMISTVVALFATLAIMQSFAVSEGYRRTATSGGDAAFSGAVGTYLLGRDLQMAGYGINTPAYLGCTVSGFDKTLSQPISFTLTPAQITAGAGSNPDSITVVASNTGWLPAPITLTTSMASATDNYQINAPFGVTAGDVLVLAQSGNNACTLVQATNTPTTASPGSQNTVKHVSGSYQTAGGATVSARYNPSGGIGQPYPAGSVLMDLGAQPTVNTYFIQNNTLMVTQDVTAPGQPAQPVAANIVQLKAVYGKDTVGGGTITAWNTTAPVTAADWAAVLAIRVALVARSAQPERVDPTTGNCSTTTASPKVTWDDGTQTTLDLTATAPGGPAWQCYRYKVFHMTASLRNSIWTPS
jgi:type IV pilus assembly protein PilW